MDKQTTFEEIKGMIDDFCKRRQWNGSSAKDLALSLVLEATELLEIFQWKEDEVLRNPDELTHLKEEISDVMWYCFRLCSDLDIDVTDAIMDKAAKNAVKYPEPKTTAIL